MLAVVVVAALAATLCHEAELGRSFARSILQAASFIPARRWALYASYGDEAAIYYFFVFPILPLAATWMLARHGFPLPAKLQQVRGIFLAIQTVIAVPLLAFVGLIILIGEHGSDMRGLKVGTQFGHLIFFGWVSFAAAGAAFGLCGLYLLAALGAMKRASRE
ncbi:hypothetical protein VI08_16865 [Luteibacter yeojuensis]|uniref:Uncharacterized protein n=2 Tax=Luteibacter yeojuensis TaxID=345309 RepID=A0A0F3KE92_9GAMM|nr:hypothetical protein VI08_16865 [Luteibacter yeojuensis]